MPSRPINGKTVERVLLVAMAGGIEYQEIDLCTSSILGSSFYSVRRVRPSHVAQAVLWFGGLTRDGDSSRLTSRHLVLEGLDSLPRQTLRILPRRYIAGYQPEFRPDQR